MRLPYRGCGCACGRTAAPHPTAALGGPHVCTQVWRWVSNLLTAAQHVGSDLLERCRPSMTSEAALQHVTKLCGGAGAQLRRAASGCGSSERSASLWLHAQEETGTWQIVDVAGGQLCYM